MLIDTPALKQNLSCQAYLASKGYELAGRGEEKWLPQGCPFCGTKHPGQSDRFRVWPDGFWCRQCGSKGDIITLTEMLERTDFRGAIQMLGVAELPKVEVKTQECKPWDAKSAARMATHAQHLLFESGHIGQKYLLEKRRLYPHTWERFGFGFTWNRFGKPAIVIPWYRKQQVVGIKYRYVPVSNKPLSHKSDSEDGSMFIGNLYGGHAQRLTSNVEHRRLLLIEGELNAASVWQVAGDWIDIACIGSQGHKLTDEQAEFLSQYGTKLVWLDEASSPPEVPFIIQKAEQIGASWVTSMKLGKGTKKDANDLLLDGTLGATLVKLFLKIADDEQRKQLVWDLSEATTRPNADPATVEYCKERGLWR